MAIKKTKKLSAQQTTTTVATGEKFAKVDANGKVTLIDLANLKTALLGGANLDAMLDGVFIMYHRKGDDFPVLAKPRAWAALQNSGEIADGVLIAEGGKMLVVAPSEANSVGWSSAAVSAGATTTNDRVIAMGDWNGKANTASIIAANTSNIVTNTSAYAAGFCNLYSRTNANGKGLTAGKWWLPSVGEMLMIYFNINKINYCLSLISGATQLINSNYWTSTEYNVTYPWVMNTNDGAVGFWNTKAAGVGRVRPVSAFIV